MSMFRTYYHHFISTYIMSMFISVLIFISILASISIFISIHLHLHLLLNASLFQTLGSWGERRAGERKNEGGLRPSLPFLVSFPLVFSLDRPFFFACLQLPRAWNRLLNVSIIFSSYHSMSRHTSTYPSYGELNNQILRIGMETLVNQSTICFRELYLSLSYRLNRNNSLIPSAVVIQ